MSKTGLRWKKYRMPPTMENISYMDVGCDRGDMVDHAKKLGATQVLGVDYATGPKLNPSIPFLQCDILSDKFLELPQFNIVSCFGLIYHTANPAGVIQRLKTKVQLGGHLMIETEYVDLNSSEPLWKLLPTNEGAEVYSNWWFPNVEGMAKLLVACGFTSKVVFKNDHRVCFKALPINELNPKTSPGVGHSRVGAGWDA